MNGSFIDITFIVSGGFAFVFVAQDLANGKEYALKVYIKT